LLICHEKVQLRLIRTVSLSVLLRFSPPGVTKDHKGYSFVSLCDLCGKEFYPGILIQKWFEKLSLDVDPKLASTATGWAIDGLAVQWSHDNSRKRPSAEKFIDEVLPLITENLRLVQPA
jgi:hypothetical protein